MKIINPNEYGSLLFDEKELNSVKDVLTNEKIFRYANRIKSKVDEFEDMLKKFVNAKYALGVTNGTSGLITALIGAGVKENDRVLISSYTFLATALAVKSVGATPIPIEIDLKKGFDLLDLETELKKGCKAVIVVQLQGRCFDLSEVVKLVKRYDAVLIEDSCQGFGAKNKTNYAGTIGDIGVYSFQQFKQITCGEGGAIVTNNKIYYDRMRNYSDMGSNRILMPEWNSDNVLFGQNYRMNNISGAILCEQMKKINRIIEKQQNSRKYILENIKSKKIINSPFSSGDTGMNILLLLDTKEEYKKLKEKALDYNIEIRYMWNGLYFDNNLFKRNNLTDIDLKKKECIKTRDIIERMAVISIPPILTKDNCNTIVKFINENCD